MDLETVIYEKSNHIVTITMNRPERLNALSPSLARDLNQSWEAFKNDADAWVAIITGTGPRGFCAGADLKDAADRYKRGEPGPSGVTGYVPSAHDIWKPIIAAVNGHAVGAGLGIAVDCDIVIASENATFLDPHVSTVGWPGPAVMVLPRLIPWTSAMRMLLMGIHERMPAQRAYEVGLVTEVVPLPKLMPRAREIAETILLNSPLAVWGTKEVAMKSARAGLDQVRPVWKKQHDICAASKDSKEGVRAFVEKRKPQYVVG